MKKIIKLMALITVLTFCIGTTVFASESTDYVSPGKEDIEMGNDGGNDDQSTGLDDEDESDKSEAGGTASPQTSASVAPIVAVVGLAAAGAATGLKRK